MKQSIAALTSNLIPVQCQQILSISPRIFLGILFSVAINPAQTLAQAIPDGTLPTSVEQLQEIMRINGGEREGNNLFHSFEEFSIPEGMEAVFENALDIENIFTRITGADPSTIKGFLRTQGDANFFLVNPNGIIFGENARLDLGGSFIATTADSIQFEGGTEFSASNSTPEPVLKMNVPIGLGFGSNNGAITVNSSGNQIQPSFSSTPTTVTHNGSLSIDSKQTLALIGGEISFSGGTITTNGGLIELGGVDSGFVQLQQVDNGFAFNYQNANSYQNIELANLSILKSNGEGEISLTGNNITLQDGSLILNQNLRDISSDTIRINATNLTLTGSSPNDNVSSAIRSETLNSGTGADIRLSTKNLVLQDGGRIGTTSYAEAKSGDLLIDSTNSVQLLDNSVLNSERPTFLVNGISTVAAGNGSGGELNLNTSNLKITNGGSVQTSASRTGDSGALTINAINLEISGINPNPERRNPSALISSVNSGTAGNSIINASKIKISDGGAIGSSTFGSGNAGDVIINASESIEVQGESNNLSSRLSSSVVSLTSNEARARIGVSETPSGQGGNVTVNTPIFNVNQGGEASVSNVGTGNAGTLSINAEELNLNQAGKITAATASGTGGNITLDTKNLQISDGSEITATADNDGDGGNITINTNTLLAKKKQSNNS